MIILGLVGGIASGKSLVANILRDMGAVVLDADQAGHYVLRQPEVIEELKKRWGDKILDAKGQVNRREVARIVFGQGNEGELKFLEQLTHPRIEELLQTELEAIRELAEPPPVVVIDAPLLFEAGWDKYCDKVLYVDAPRDVRLERAVARGWSTEQFAAREASQMPLIDKASRSHIVIRNAKTLEHIRDVLRLTWRHRLVGEGIDGDSAG
jgi:dephospho-CoA kinase